MEVLWGNLYQQSGAGQMCEIILVSLRADLRYDNDCDLGSVHVESQHLLAIDIEYAWRLDSALL